MQPSTKAVNCCQARNTLKQFRLATAVDAHTWSAPPRWTDRVIIDDYADNHTPYSHIFDRLPGSVAQSDDDILASLRRMLTNNYAFVRQSYDTRYFRMAS